LRHIHDYIAHDSRIYAKRIAEELVRKTIGLDALPRRGRVVPELNDENVREIPVYSYRVIYEIKGPDIQILAVIHKRRSIQVDDIPR
jgi:plasmid stabilization system protein ParE